MTIESVLKREFPDNLFKKGKLCGITLEPRFEQKYNILLIGPEHGDKHEPVNAMMEMARVLAERPLKTTKITMIPTLDAEGYPGKRTSYGKDKDGNALYLDSFYDAYITCMKSDNETELPAVLHNIADILSEGFDMVVQLNTSIVEKNPLLNGFYCVTQTRTEKEGDRKRIVFPFRESTDIIGSVLNGLRENGTELLKIDEIVNNYVPMRPGFLLENSGSKDDIEIMTVSGFMKLCEMNRNPCIAFYAPSSRKHPKDFSPVDTLITAVDYLLQFYEFNYKLHRGKRRRY